MCKLADLFQQADLALNKRYLGEAEIEFYYHREDTQQMCENSIWLFSPMWLNYAELIEKNLYARQADLRNRWCSIFHAG